MGGLAGALPYLGAGAQGFMQGRQQGVEMQRQQRQDAFNQQYQQGQLQEMAARIKSEMDPLQQATPDYIAALQQLEPGEDGQQGFNLPQSFGGNKGDVNTLFRVFQEHLNRHMQMRQQNMWAGYSQLDKIQNELGRLENTRIASERARHPNGAIDMEIVKGDPDLQSLYDQSGHRMDDVIAQLEQRRQSAINTYNHIAKMLGLDPYSAGPAGPYAPGGGGRRAGGVNPQMLQQMLDALGNVQPAGE